MAKAGRVSWKGYLKLSLVICPIEASGWWTYANWAAPRCWEFVLTVGLPLAAQRVAAKRSASE